VRRIGGVQSLDPHLNIHLFPDPENPEEAGIHVDQGGPTQGIETGISETHVGHRAECGDIEVRLAGANPAQGLNAGLHLVGLLIGSSTRVQRSGAGGDAVREARACGEETVELPSANDVRKCAAWEEILPDPNAPYTKVALSWCG
jgi:hypothetical protein